MTGDRVSRSCDVGPSARLLGELYWGRVKLQGSMEYGATVVLEVNRRRNWRRRLQLQRVCFPAPAEPLSASSRCIGERVNPKD
jgi:hypothetical protein